MKTPRQRSSHDVTTHGIERKRLRHHIAPTQRVFDALHISVFDALHVSVYDALIVRLARVLFVLSRAESLNSNYGKIQGSMTAVHIVYICSVDRKAELLTSIGTVLSSGTIFDRITVYCIGPYRDSFNFPDERITIEVKPALHRHLWMENKTYLSHADGDRVLFLDTDTFVLKPLNLLFENMKGVVAGRLATATSEPDWPEDVWLTYLEHFGATSYVPYLNTGVLCFTHGANRLLNPSWLHITHELRRMKHVTLHGFRNSNQLAFSLACGSLGLSYHLLEPADHSYGWQRESFHDSVVYHSSHKLSYHYTRLIENHFGILLRKMRLPVRQRLHQAFFSLIWRMTYAKMGS